MAILNNWSLGAEVQVNFHIFAVGGLSGTQTNSEVAALDDGRFMVVFESNAGTSGGNTVFRIHAQAFNADGTPFGLAREMPFTFPLGHSDPAIAPLGGTGAGIIVWADATNGADTDIKIAFFSPEDGTQGSLFIPNPLATDTVALHDPDVASSSNGNQLVVFERDTAAGNHDIQMSIRNSNGTNVEKFDINVGTANQSAPVIAVTGDRALVVYEDNTLGASTDLRANLYDQTAETGAGATASFLIANNADGLSSPDLATLNDGRVVVVYSDANGAILARIFDPATYDSANPSATPMPSVEITIAADSGSAPSVSATPDGGFVVVWDDLSSGVDGDVGARRFDAAGNPAGDTFLIPDPEGLSDGAASVAVNALGQSFISWDSIGSAATTDADFGIQGITGSVTNAVNNGTADADTFSGYAIGEIINGLGGSDQILGNGGNDALDGGADDDEVTGGDGNDQLRGGAGADRLSGGDGDDTFRIMGTEGLGDTYSGGDGVDRIEVIGGTAVTLAGFNAGSSGIERWIGNAQALLGTAANNSFNFSALIGKSGLLFVDAKGGNDTVIGSKFSDDLRGGSGNDTLRGAGDTDKLFGETGNDRLSGEAGRDTLTGGLGRDILSGGADKDVFDFNSVSESPDGPNRDVIDHFQRGLDDIDLRSIDAKTGVSGNNAFKFIGTDAFTGVKGELRIKDLGSQVIVQADVNGNGKADFEILVKTGSLAKSDFLL